MYLQTIKIISLRSNYAKELTACSCTHALDDSYIYMPLQMIGPYNSVSQWQLWVQKGSVLLVSYVFTWNLYKTSSINNQYRNTIEVSRVPGPHEKECGLILPLLRLLLLLLLQVVIFKVVTSKEGKCLPFRVLGILFSPYSRHFLKTRWEKGGKATFSAAEFPCEFSPCGHIWEQD